MSANSRTGGFQSPSEEVADSVHEKLSFGGYKPPLLVIVILLVWFNLALAWPEKAATQASSRST
ncbi:MAG TPA: hypothetical protein VIT91_13435 [Chthoniobacterales bacterium]